MFRVLEYLEALLVKFPNSSVQEVNATDPQSSIQQCIMSLYVNAPLVESEQAWSRPEVNQWMVDEIVVNCFNWVLDQVKTNRTKYLLCFGSLGAKTIVGPEVFEDLFFHHPLDGQFGPNGP